MILKQKNYNNFVKDLPKQEGNSVCQFLMPTQQSFPLACFLCRRCSQSAPLEHKRYWFEHVKFIRASVCFLEWYWLSCMWQGWKFWQITFRSAVVSGTPPSTTLMHAWISKICKNICLCRAENSPGRDTWEAVGQLHLLLPGQSHWENLSSDEFAKEEDSRDGTLVWWWHSCLLQWLATLGQETAEVDSSRHLDFITTMRIWLEVVEKGTYDQNYPKWFRVCENCVQDGQGWLGNKTEEIWEPPSERIGD